MRKTLHLGKRFVLLFEHMESNNGVEKDEKAQRWLFVNNQFKSNVDNFTHAKHCHSFTTRAKSEPNKNLSSWLLESKWQLYEILR